MFTGHQQQVEGVFPATAEWRKPYKSCTAHAQFTIKEEEQQLSTEKVRAALMKVKSGKAAGSGEVTIDML